MVSSAGVETSDRSVATVAAADGAQAPGQIDGSSATVDTGAPSYSPSSATSSSEGTIDVDFEALEDFMSVFGMLRDHVESAIATVSGTTADGLGTFDEAVALMGEHTGFQEEHLARLDRLRQAVDAAEAATAQVIANYTATEDVATSNVEQLVTAIGGPAGSTGAAGNRPGLIAGHGPTTKEA